METCSCEEMRVIFPFLFPFPFYSPFNNLSRNPISLIGGRLEKRNLKLYHGASCNRAKLAHAHLESGKRSCLPLECVNHKNDAVLAGFLLHAQKTMVQYLLVGLR